MRPLTAARDDGGAGRPARSARSGTTPRATRAVRERYSARALHQTWASRPRRARLRRGGRRGGPTGRSARGDIARVEGALATVPYSKNVDGLVIFDHSVED